MMLGAITSFKATKADTFTAEFDAAVPETATATVTRGTDSVPVTPAWNEARTALTLVGTANFSTGEYTLTVADGSSSVTATATVENQKVAEIKITSPTALTDSKDGVDNKVAYIYYDVLDQYGESMRTSAKVDWTVSSSARTTYDASLGRITIEAADDSTFTYGTDIYVVGVNVKSGVSVNTSVKIGMAQAVDTVKFEGFVDKSDKTKKIDLDKLPANFSKDRYCILFSAYDQNGSPLVAEDVDVTTITLISDNPMLVDTSFKFYRGDDIVGDNYNEDAPRQLITIDGTSYLAAWFNPGVYAGKGGEVNVTVIANKTGNKTIQLITIGGTPQLKSLVLEAPSKVVADADQNVKIPYTATDMDGNAVTAYETIARSSNTLSIQASEGVLRVKEEDDGTAGVYWSDSLEVGEDGEPLWAEMYNKSTSSDDIDRPISLTTVVIGGESSNLILQVSDMRRPDAISSIKLNDDNNDAIVSGNKATIDLMGGISYLDQYGEEFKGSVEGFFRSHFNNETYSVRAVSKESGPLVGDADVVAELQSDNGYVGIAHDYELPVIANLENENSYATVNVDYSIVTLDEEKGQWVNANKVKSVTYTVVGLKRVTNNLNIVTNSDLYQVVTANTGSVNGTTIEGELGDIRTDAATGPEEGELNVNAGNRSIAVTGTFNGLTLTLPTSAYKGVASAASDVLVKDDVITGIRDGAIKWAELYDVNSAKYTRKNVNKTLKLEVNLPGEENPVVVQKNLAFSDAMPGVAGIQFWMGWWVSQPPYTYTVAPDNTNLYLPWINDCSWRNGGWGVYVTDQYGGIYGDEVGEDFSVNFRVSDIVESPSELTHKPNSFDVKGNGASVQHQQDVDGRVWIEGAEIGDKFALTASVDGTPLSIRADVTVGADGEAYITTASADLVNGDQPDVALQKTLDLK